jgi:hypothetical protein
MTQNDDPRPDSIPASSPAEDERRIRERAYRLWEEEGHPEGRDKAHWDTARELVAIEDSYRDTLKPNPTEEYANNPTTEPIEPLEAVRNAGEFPTLVDQGEEATFPDRALAGEADEAPLRPGRRSTPAARKGQKKKAPDVTPGA